MRTSSTYRVLYLLNLLSQKDCTKKEILDEFQKIGQNVSKPSVNCYINKLIDNKFDIKIIKNKNENVYHLNFEPIKLELNSQELKNIDELKKILIAQKDYNKIRKFVRILYKIVLLAKDEETKHKLLDFGYYSYINWNLVKQLEGHCKNKNLIEIDYVLTSCEKRKITIHCEDIKIADWSDRLYLWGVFKNASQLSYLPVDRIFKVNKVIKQNCSADIKINTITYKISKNLYDEISLDNKEKVIEQNDKYVLIQRILKDEFYLLQRLLSFCPDLYYISDEKIKNLVKEKLEQINSYYEKEYE